MLEQSLGNSNLIGLALLPVKAVIGPSLRKMSLRTGAVPTCIRAEDHVQRCIATERVYS